MYAEVREGTLLVIFESVAYKYDLLVEKPEPKSVSLPSKVRVLKVTRSNDTLFLYSKTAVYQSRDFCETFEQVCAGRFHCLYCDG